jgi:uncharacterized protein YcaQ
VTEQLSLKQARRIALAAQGFGGRRPERVGAAQVRGTLERLSLFQIDSVNVLVRAHYLPAFSRLGGYDPALIARDAWGPRRQRRMFEYWAHEASLLPLALQPLLRWRMDQAERGETGWKGLRRFAGEQRPAAMAVLARIAQEGPLAASDFEGKGAGGWWGWSESKAALEWLFWAGRITTVTRRASFERVYDLSERVIPAAVMDLPTPDPADARRALMERGARSLGVATATDLRDYFRLKPEESRAAIAELVEEGVLLPAEVRGWSQPAFLHRDARRPRRIEAAALLAPFDPLVWERARSERLFDFRYRIEIYVPAAQRTHGYYVLPFLLDEALVGRVDLKADRQAGVLIAHRVTREPGAPSDTRDRLETELKRMADWLGLGAVRIGEVVG